MNIRSGPNNIFKFSGGCKLEEGCMTRAEQHRANQDLNKSDSFGNNIQTRVVQYSKKHKKINRIVTSR